MLRVVRRIKGRDAGALAFEVVEFDRLRPMSTGMDIWVWISQWISTLHVKKLL